MPPPMPNPSKRMTANPARPVARYRPGKATQNEESSSDEEDEEDEAPEVPSRRPQIQPARQIKTIKPRPTAQVEEDEDDEEGFVTEEEDDSEEEVAAVTDRKARQHAAGAKPPQQGTGVSNIHTKPVTASTESTGGEESTSEDEEEDESDEEESSSEEEQPQRKFQRPTFIKKTDRKVPTDFILASHNAESETRDSFSTPMVLDDPDQARRREQTDLLIKDTLERDALARLAGKKNWDDDDDLAPEDMVDDTDGLDSAAEHSAWRLREFQRLRRDREALIARERELEEVERRRNLSAAEREAEDREFLSKQKEEKEDGRSKSNYLSKYHHKGAFFQDDEAAELMKKRDLMGAKFVDDVADKSTLPEYMRIRDMTQLGKKGRTRYTDLRGQDTGRFGEQVKRWKGSGYNNDRTNDTDIAMGGVDERFMPDGEGGGRREYGSGQQRHSASGANASAVGSSRKYDRSRRKSRSRSPPRGPKGDERGTKGDSYRPVAGTSSRRHRSRSKSLSSAYSRSRSRSRSGDRGSIRRRRSPSPYEDRDRDREKRRRIEA